MDGAAGIIAEYNPFHNGHAHHIAAARAAAGRPFVVCVMSGAFVQRGDVAIVDKWTRARCALLGGADAVFELPALYAVRAAPDFARGAVALLKALGVVGDVAFGSELPLDALAEEARAESPGTSAAVARSLGEGKSYARAVGEARGQYEPLPNSTLGVEYIRAIHALGADMTPRAIPRTIPRGGTGAGAFAPASHIRRLICEGAPCAAFMPQYARIALDAALAAQGGGACIQGLETLLLDTLRARGEDGMGSILGAGEGLERRLARLAREAGSYDELIMRVKCKRYTLARIRRLCAAALLGMEGGLAEAYPSPPYARLLGFRRANAGLLGDIKRASAVPIIAKAADFDARHPVFALDVRAQDLFALACSNPGARRAGRDFTSSPVVV